MQKIFVALPWAYRAEGGEQGNNHPVLGSGGTIRADRKRFGTCPAGKAGHGRDYGTEKQADWSRSISPRWKIRLHWMIWSWERTGCVSATRGCAHTLSDVDDVPGKVGTDMRYEVID